jgi:hypothetical protein
MPLSGGLPLHRRRFVILALRELVLMSRRVVVELLHLWLRLFDVEVLKTFVIVCLFRDNEVVHQNT